MFQKGMIIIGIIASSAMSSPGQNISGQLNIAVQKLTTDEHFKHAIIGLYVADSKTGNTIFDKNSGSGLAPASCQKIITSTSAFELLGNSFQFKTYIDADGKIGNGVLEGNLYLTGVGDPTLGSKRWKMTAEPLVLKKILEVLDKNKIRSVSGNLVCNDNHFTNDPVPGGWVWEDIGNYYGAGAWGLNWKENQFDITFKTGKSLDDSTEIISTDPTSILKDYTFANLVKTGDKGSGDNGYIFSAPFHQNIIARGTVPMSANGFTISGAMPDPPQTFINSVYQYLQQNGVTVSGTAWSSSAYLLNNKMIKVPRLQHRDSILSPALDSINYWFLKKSVNLFGEALVKMIAYDSQGSGNTDSGVSVIREFWSTRGIEKSALKIIDGSGLSPANRVSTRSLVTVLQYAAKRPWFASFYNALPDTHGIKMKDGYISGVRSYAGYVKSKRGTGYTFAFIVNNFDGNPGTVREKMWKILDVLLDN